MAFISKVLFICGNNDTEKILSECDLNVEDWYRDDSSVEYRICKEDNNTENISEAVKRIDNTEHNLDEVDYVIFYIA